MELNKDTLTEYLRTSKVVRDINTKIATDLKTHYLEDTYMNFFAGALIPVLLFMKIKTVKELDLLLTSKKELIQDEKLTNMVYEFSHAQGRADDRGLAVGVCIVRLVIIMALETKNQSKINKSFKLYNWSKERENGVKRIFTKWAEEKLWNDG